MFRVHCTVPPRKQKAPCSRQVQRTPIRPVTSEQRCPGPWWRSTDLHTVISADGRYQFVSAHGLGAFGWAPELFVCTTSVGIGVTADVGRGAEALLQEADLALYSAKDCGRHRAEVYDQDGPRPQTARRRFGCGPSGQWSATLPKRCPRPRWPRGSRTGVAW